MGSLFQCASFGRHQHPAEEDYGHYKNVFEFKLSDEMTIMSEIRFGNMVHQETGEKILQLLERYI